MTATTHEEGSQTPVGHALGIVADALVAGLGLFQLWFTVCVRTGLSFRALLYGLPVWLVATVAVVRWVRSADRDAGALTQDSDHLLPDGPVVASLVLACVAIGLWQGGVLTYPQLWVVLLGHLALAAWGTGARLPWRTGGGAWDAAVLAGTGIIGAVAALTLHRPEGDDAYYLSQVTGNLGHPGLPLLGFDVMHGDVTLPIQQPAHRGAAYETFVSAVSAATGIGAFDAYYIVLPACFALVAPLGIWLVGRALGGVGVGRAAAGVSVAVLLLWAGDYYTPGNFTYVRLFQGKGVYMAVYGPLLMHRGLHFVARPGGRTWLMLMLGQTAAAACTSTALVVAPLLAALVVLPGLSFDRRGVRMALLGGVSAIPVVLMLWMVKLDVDAMPSFGDEGYLRNLHDSFGAAGRSALALIGVVMLPLAARWARGVGRDVAARYIFFAVLLLVNEQVAEVAAEHLSTLYRWRLYWAFPFHTVMSVSLGFLAVLTLSQQPQVHKATALAGLVAWVAAFGAAGMPTWAGNNGVFFDWPSHKVHRQETRLAELILAETGPDDLVVAPEKVSRRIAPYPGSPPLLNVKRAYTRHLGRALGAKEVSRRLRMLDTVEDPPVGGEVGWISSFIDNRCVTVFVMEFQAAKRQVDLDERLERRGFRMLPTTVADVGQHEIWVREPDDCLRWAAELDRRRAEQGTLGPGEPDGDAEETDDAAEGDTDDG